MTWQHMLAVRRWPVDPTARHVAMVIASHANRHGRAWPGWETIAAETGYSRATVARAIGRLETASPLEIIHRPGLSCEYLFPQIAHPSHSVSHPSHSETDPSRSETRSFKSLKREARKAGAARSSRSPAAAEPTPIHNAGGLADRLEQIRRRSTP